MDKLLEALSAGKLCIVDVSQLRGGPALSLSGIILRRIFDHNQEEFTSAQPRTIPTIAVVEEAQAVLNERAPAARPYIEWVKEGRKYDLGALLITQQPGAIPTEILSQGDNWFIFHLLSSADLRNVQTANSHFSGDLLSSLLNEPIVGQGVFWSSVKGSPYPIPLRVLSFEHMYQRQDQAYTRAAVETYATKLKQKYAAQLTEAEAAVSAVPQRVEGELFSAASPGGDGDSAVAAERPVDVLRLAQQRAIEALGKKRPFWDKLDSGGIKWGFVTKLLEAELPETMSDRNQVAYGLVKQAVNTLIGPENEKWRTEKRNGSTFIVRA
jgi:DNA helicase HerA-like ATPase